MKKILLIIIGISLIMFGCKHNSKQNVLNEPKQAIITVKSEDVTFMQSFPAILRGKQDIAIYPQIEGKIIKVCVEEGASVRNGQVLFVIDQSSYKTAVATAQANVQAAQARVSNALLTLKSKQELKKQNIISDFTVAQATNAWHTAQAELAQAKAELINANNNLSYTIIRSSSNGVIGTLPYKVGSLVSPTMQNPLTVVSDNSEMIAYFSLSEQQFISLIQQYGSRKEILSNMPQVTWQMSDGSAYEHKGNIVTISGLLDEKTGSVNVRAKFDNSNQKLISRATGNVLMPLTLFNALVIPQKATKQLQDKITVNKIIGNKTKMTLIEVYPINNGTNYVVTQGLQKGDKITIN